MNIDKSLLLPAAAALFISCGRPDVRGRHPAIAIISEFQEVDEEGYIVPYSANLMAIYDLESGRPAGTVKDYLDWYLAHLNYPDKAGLGGTIYDLRVGKDGSVRFTDTYDSVDSYSATFLMLAHRYYLKTKDAQFLREHRQKLQDIAHTIASLQDADGLIMTSGVLKVKFLMNNCEDYGGITAFIDIAREMGWPLESRYREVRDKLREGIMANFYYPEKQIFFWAIDEQLRRTGSSWETFYPDAYAQLFPLYYGLLAGDSGLRSSLWNTFQRRYGGAAAKLPAEQEIMYKLVRKAMSG